VMRGEEAALERPLGNSGSSSERVDGWGKKEPVAVRRKVGCRLLGAVFVATCLKHSWPHGSEYPKHGPVESQFVFVSFTKDKTRFCTSIIEGLRSYTSVADRVILGVPLLLPGAKCSACGGKSFLLDASSEGNRGVDSVAFPFDFGVLLWFVPSNP
jgi:hypothetical protein